MFKEILNLKMQLWLADLVGAIICCGVILIIYSIYFAITNIKDKRKKDRRK